MRYAMVINTYKCVGCNACTVICKEAHATAPGIFWNRVYSYEVGRYPNARIFYFPALCMHCANPPCVKFCPTGASYKRKKDGLVLIDQKRCIGCRACISSCPYEARFLNYRDASYYGEKGPSIYEKVRGVEHAPGSVSKCTFCVEELMKGKEPICVTTCATRARIFGDLDDPKSEVARIVSTRQACPYKAELGTGPSVFYGT